MMIAVIYNEGDGNDSNDGDFIVDGGDNHGEKRKWW